MSTEIPTFGEYLTAIMDAHNWPSDRLAKALGVDRSLVYRWRRNDRAPKLDTPYLDQVSALLELTAEEAHLLEQARIRTLRECHLPWRSALCRRRRGPDSVLPPRNGAIRGRRQAFEAGLELLQRVPEAPDANGARKHEIIIVSAFEHLARTPQKWQMLEQWQQALRGAMRRGWQVTIIWHLDRHVERAGQIALRLLELVGIPGFQPCYFEPVECSESPTNSLIIPGYAGYFNLCADNLVTPDAAVIVRDKSILDALYYHFGQLKALAQPLVECLPREAAAAGESEHECWDDVPGGRWLVKGDLSFFSQPRSWWCPHSTWARGQSCSPAELAARIERRGRRHAHLDRRVTEEPRYEICTMRAFTALLRVGCYVSDGAPLATDYRAQLTSAERVEHVRHVVQLLQTHENYHLGLADGAEAQALRIADHTQWMATGDDRAILAIAPPGADVTERDIWTDFLIAEPIIGAAFRRRFLAMWQQLAPEHREKEHVIRWLEHQLAKGVS